MWQKQLCVLPLFHLYLCERDRFCLCLLVCLSVGRIIEDVMNCGCSWVFWQTFTDKNGLSSTTYAWLTSLAPGGKIRKRTDAETWDLTILVFLSVTLRLLLRSAILRVERDADTFLDYRESGMTLWHWYFTAVFQRCSKTTSTLKNIQIKFVIVNMCCMYAVRAQYCGRCTFDSWVLGLEGQVLDNNTAVLLLLHTLANT